MNTLTMALATVGIDPYVSLGTPIITGTVGLLAIWMKWRLDRIDNRTKPTAGSYAQHTTALLEDLHARLCRVAARQERTDSRLERLEGRLLTYLEDKHHG